MKRATQLFDKVVAFDNLLLASHKAARSKRHKIRVAHFLFHLEKELLQLQDELQSGTYCPRAYHHFDIKDPKPRRISAADFRDRVVHHAVCNVLEPVFERRLIYDTWACRVGKGTHAAVYRAQAFSRHYRYFLKCDIRRFFESVDHTMLKALLTRIIKDKPLLDLLTTVIDTPVIGHQVGKGLPIGNLTSQHFANQYLGELDHYLKERLRCPAYLRYMDDFLLFAPDKPTLHRYLQQLETFLQQQLMLELKPTATLLAPVSEGIPFLGFRIFPHMIRLQTKTLQRFRSNLKALRHQWVAGQLTEEELSLSVSGMMAHIAHADTKGLRQALWQPFHVQG